MWGDIMIKGMEYVYAVYKEKSFSKAAEKLHISQPALSATVIKIEQKIGLPIFDRRVKPVSLTSFGVEYIQSIKKIYEIENHLENVVQEVNGFQRGSLSIGGSGLSIPYFVPEMICAFKQAYPNIELHLFETSTLQSKQLLDEGQADFIITNRPLNGKEYQQELLYHEHLIVAVPKEFPINKKLKDKQLNKGDMKQGVSHLLQEKGVSIAQFKEVPFIVLYQDNYLRFCTDMLFEEQKVVPNIVLEVEQTAIAYNFAQYGLGATIFSDTRMAGIKGNDKTVFYALVSPYATRDAYLYYKNNSLLTMAMRKFIELTRAQVKKKLGA